ncbi:MAG: N-formylglutamate amidohydrolase [Desulfobulbales bacterium]
MATFSCPEGYRLLVTCEHAGKRVPAVFQHLFAGRAEILDTHRAYDPGALDIARFLASSFKADLLSSQISRLLIDSNRSETNPRLFSQFSKKLSLSDKERLLAQYYRPYLSAVTSKTAEAVNHGYILVHVAVHTFIPELNGKKRTADIGLLYDPGRTKEKKLCARWKDELQQLDSSLRVRRNYPYLGKTDGLPTQLRRKFPPDHYLGIELEINQAISPGEKGHSLKLNISSSLNSALHSEA